MAAKSKNVLIGKQKRLIATRLIQISLMVDDYLYQQKPMSQKSAAAYIREISGYKDKCYQDVRSLQVIEKLNRCLNGIIHEQQELNSECVEDALVFPFQEMPKDNNEPMLSPVYSTADEDLTQLISLEINDDLLPTEQIQEKETDSNKNHDEIETIEVTTERVLPISANEEIGTDYNKVTGHFNVYPQAGNTEHPLNNDIEIIDLCDDDKDHISQSNAIRYNPEPELNIQNAISNLSIKDLEEAFTPFTQDCSQSLLDSSYNFAYTCNNVNSVRKDVALLLTHNVTRTTIPPGKPATEIVTNNKIAYVIPTTKKKLNVHAPVAKPIAIHNTHVMQNTTKDTLKLKAPKRNTKKRNDNNKLNSESSKTVATNVSNAVKTKIKQRQHNMKANGTNSITHKEVNTTYAKETQKKHSDYQYQAFNTKPSLTQKAQPSLKPITDNKFKRKDTLSIYNSAVIDDLSWIENIRFVREIPSEEYESFTDEGFWYNCNLPNQWNEADFNY